MQKFLVLISFSVLLAISIGCDRIQKIVTPPQEEETLKIGFVVAGEHVTQLALIHNKNMQAV